ncbi:MAG: single-stranded DNA-binding protein [Ardenticatenaceae bacterium]|nr:single-stranded DNA-binding protein [Ardenticatenaceae bacterium]MCB8986734.1 single-stranded DNA-binding protein [Ardenticatenaceae bacterium]
MFQKITIVGNLGRDPEMRYMPDGTAVTSLNVATSRKYTNREGQTVEETTWFKVSTWNKVAENCNQYLSKGRRVLVEGTLTPDPMTGGPRIWTRQDGTCGASFEIRATEVRFLGGSNDGNGNGHNVAPSPVEEDSDIPF